MTTPQNQISVGAGLAFTGAILQVSRLLVLTPMLNSGHVVQESTSTYSLAVDQKAVTSYTVPIEIVCLVGFILITVSLVAYRYRQPWLFWFLMIYGVIAFFSWAGFFFSIFFYIYCLRHRKEFQASSPMPPPSA